MSANGASAPDDEKDYGNNHEHLDADMHPDSALRKVRTAGSISIAPDLFEKLYLAPRDAAATGTIRKVVGNPTPVALVGFLLALTPLSCDLMGWRGAGQANGAASIGAYLFFGGVLMIIGGTGEFIVGNTFPSVVFLSFGGFWLTYGSTLQDGFYGAQTAYTMNANGAVPSDVATANFYNAFSFVLLWMGFLCLIYLVCALRTNVVFVMIFFTLIFAFSFLAATFWYLAQGNTALASRLVVAGGAFAFVTSLSGWWIFAAILLAALDHPLVLPVGDLSGVIKGKNEKMKQKEAMNKV